MGHDRNHAPWYREARPVTRILGIDPGISGALGLLLNGRYECVSDMPTMQRGVTSKKQAVNASELAKLIRAFEPHVVVVELVQAMPRVGSSSGMGAASAFNFGESAGVVRGVIAALGLECHYVTPQSWKKRAGLIGSDKEASRAKAIQLWPMASLARKKDQGRAEALLIARFGAPVQAPADPFEIAFSLSDSDKRACTQRVTIP